MSKTAPKAPAMAAPADEPGNTEIDGMAALDGMVDAGVILTGRGMARCHSALSGIRSITDILFQLECDKDSTGGIQASTRTTTGLLQALSVCAEFVTDHLNGGGTAGIFAQAVKVDSPAYAELTAMHETARKGATS